MSQKIFEGKKALVLGGSGGIGKSLSLLLAKKGAELVIHGSQKSEKTERLSQKIHEISGKSPKFIFCNLFEEPFGTLDSSELFESAKKCDILCICFGPFIQKSLEETSLSDWQKAALFDYALPGALVSAALPAMKKNRWGRILLFGGSGTAHRNEFSTNAAYAGAKSGLNVLLASTAAFYADYGITCNMILPGFTETEYLSEPAKLSLSKKMPLGSMLKPESLAESALFLLENADINGAALRVDRGWSALKSLNI